MQMIAITITSLRTWILVRPGAYMEESCVPIKRTFLRFPVAAVIPISPHSNHPRAVIQKGVTEFGAAVLLDDRKGGLEPSTTVYLR